MYNLFHRYLYTPSAKSLAHFLNEYSLRNKGLSFVQIGANDGYNRDPYVKFIHRDKWLGVLVEPQPFVYNTFLKKLYQNSKRISTANYAIDTTEGSRILYKLSFSNARWATGLSTFDKKVLESSIDSGYIAGHAQKNGIDLPSRKEDYIDEVEIKTISPQKLLQENKIGSVDLLAIDTEGFDLEIIKMFDISTISPRVIVYENLHLSETDSIEAKALLQQNGYRTIKIGKDSVAIKKDDRDCDLLKLL